MTFEEWVSHSGCIAMKVGALVPGQPRLDWEHSFFIFLEGNMRLLEPHFIYLGSNGQRTTDNEEPEFENLHFSSNYNLVPPNFEFFSDLTQTVRMWVLKGTH